MSFDTRSPPRNIVGAESTSIYGTGSKILRERDSQLPAIPGEFLQLYFATKLTSIASSVTYFDGSADLGTQFAGSRLRTCDPMCFDFLSSPTANMTERSGKDSFGSSSLRLVAGGRAEKIGEDS
eukprot:2109247-Pleurochrysis_carterae.AAC.4